MKNLIFILLAYLVYADDTLNPIECGHRLDELGGVTKNVARVVGGIEAQPGDWGWQVALNYNSELICGGTLINSQWILTAAKCVYGKTNPQYYSIILGAHDRRNIESYAVVRLVSNIIIHPQYDSLELKNNIALIKLEVPVKYSRYIVPACLSDGSNAYNGRYGYATGWGSLSLGGRLTSELHQANITIINDERCAQKYVPKVDTKIDLCGGDTNLNSDTCQGDQGGPLVVKHDSTGTPNLQNRWALVGITSWGYDCRDGSVYTRVSNYESWIKGVMKSH